MSVFQSEWLDDPAFKDWLSGIAGDERAFCKVCNKYLYIYSGKGALRSHGSGVKHSELLLQAQNKSKKQASDSTAIRSNKSFGVPSQSTVNLNFINTNSGGSVPSSSIFRGSTTSVKSESPKKPKIESIGKQQNPSTSSYSPLKSLEYSPPSRSRSRSRSTSFSSSESDLSPSRSMTNLDEVAENCLEKKIKQMVQNHVKVIRDDGCKYFEFYQRSVRGRKVPSADERCRKVERILDYYEEEHKKLAKKVKCHLTLAAHA